MNATPLPGLDVRTSAAFPGARLLTVPQPDGGAIPVAAHLGNPDRDETVVEALDRWAWAYAARDALLRQGDALQTALSRIGGKPTNMDFRTAASVAAQRRIETSILAGCLVRGDAYRSTKAIEREYRTDGDDTLYRLVSGIVDDAMVTLRSEATRIQAARRLSAASPGPATLLRRMEAEMLGLSQPDDAIVPLPPGRRGHALCLGTILVTPDGERTARGPVELTVVASFDPGFTDFNPDGSVDSVALDLSLLHDPATWDPLYAGELYGDRPTEDAVNALLAARGLTGRASWSERGRQSSYECDMDAPPGLAEQLWPELMAEARAKAAPVPAP